MTDESHTPSPPRLVQSSTALAALLSDVEAEYREGVDEARAWQRLRARLGYEESPPVAATARTRRRIWSAAAIAAGFVIGWFGWKQFEPSPVAVAPANRAPRTELSEVAPLIHLAEGTSRLPDGTEVQLADGAAGTYIAEKERSTLEFDRGRLQIAVAKQTNGHTFVVKAKRYEFVVLGTKFKVAVVGGRVDLDVAEGRVAVHDSEHTLKVVEAGGHWSNLEGKDPNATDGESDATTGGVSDATTGVTMETPAAAPAQLSAKIQKSAAPSPAPTDPSSCRDLLHAGKATPAEACYVSLSAGTGLSAEMALYEVARLRRDVLANPSAALSALDEYEARFASGTLAPEVRMARVDLLARLGRVSEALSTSEKLLGGPEGRSRAVELRLLRGNLLADKKHDCAAAIAEYALAESDPGPRGDQAQFAHARCLEQLGRKSEARRVYESYLQRSKPARAERARQRVEALGP